MSGKNKTIYVYTKYCADCMWPEEMMSLKKYAQHFEYNLKVKRTTYRPSLHKKASEICGTEEYRAFVVMDKRVFSLESFARLCEGRLTQEGNHGEQ